MDSVKETLEKAYSIIKNQGQNITPETACIQCMFLSPSCIQAMKNDELYLMFIKSLMDERFNISFPEEPSSYDRYYSDCIFLKEQMEQNGSFQEEIWISYTVRLLEALKTPYYSDYSFVLMKLESCFSDRNIFEETLNNFYYLIIKSSESKRKIINMIADHASVYKKYPSVTEPVLSDILTNTLSLFGEEKEYWLSALASGLYKKSLNTSSTIHTEELLQIFWKKEEEFLKDYTGNFSSSSQYFSERTCWFDREISPFPYPFSQSHSIRPNTEINSEFLNTYAYNMTSKIYRTNPAIGREAEISDLELILISPKKSPILIGDAGVGKTSVVEGLSFLLQQGNVPDLLKNKKICKLTTISLLSGTKYVGEMEERIKKLTEELQKNPDIILFIDEIHTIVGAGSTESSHNDISNMLKPYIDRGDIKIIGATTKKEYEHFILPDRALARRFYPITIAEPDEAMTLSILTGSIPSIEYQTGVKNPFSKEQTEKILKQLLSTCSLNNQTENQITRMPELPLTILEMAFSYAALQKKSALSCQDIETAVLHSNRLQKETRENFHCIL